MNLMEEEKKKQNSRLFIFEESLFLNLYLFT